jgi:hypothetical protein
MRTLLSLSFFLFLTSNASAQQIGSVDLTRPPKRVDLPNGCKRLLAGIIGDGWPEPEDHVPRNIMVEVVSVKDTKPILGNELVAEVHLQNSGTQSIKIPWSNEFSSVVKDQSPDTWSWDQATFEFMLKDQQGHKVRLKSLTEALYGSKSADGSELAVKPGESITASVKFALIDEFPIPPLRLKEGEWQLSAKWIQTGRTSSVSKNCTEASGYFHYDRYYQQQSPGIAIQVKAAGSSTTQKPTE